MQGQCNQCKFIILLCDSVPKNSMYAVIFKSDYRLYRLATRNPSKTVRRRPHISPIL